jgi:hypothetical protein
MKNSAYSLTLSTLQSYPSKKHLENSLSSMTKATFCFSFTWTHFLSQNIGGISVLRDNYIELKMAKSDKDDHSRLKLGNVHFSVNK